MSAESRALFAGLFTSLACTLGVAIAESITWYGLDDESTKWQLAAAGPLLGVLVFFLASKPVKP